MVKGTKLFKTITEAELKQIIEATQKPHHKLAFALGFYEAMRVSEVVKLKPEDVDKQTKLIHIKQAKGAKDRIIPIAPEVLRGLKHLPIGVGPRALQIKFKEMGQKVLGKDIHFHTLRHSGITHYIATKGWSSLQAQRFAGHSKVQTTEIYTHINPKDLLNKMWEN